MDLRHTSYTTYLEKLGLSDLFTLRGNYQDTFDTDKFFHSLGKYAKGEINLFYDNDDDVMILHVSCSIVYEWTLIKGSLPERKIKVLEYFADQGFKPATTLLREHKIDSLTK